MTAETIESPLPGPKRRQAEALAQNIAWMVEHFGAERVGFLTLTCGDDGPAGFTKVTTRAEASRRFHSLQTNVISERYQCGVVVTERHRDGGIHFHAIVAVGGDIRSGVDFDACFPRRENGKPVHAPDYSTATPRLRLEWKFWREAAPRFGFGRHNLQPVRKPAAIGRYVGKYISKSWAARCDDDKGGRLVRYFGRWSVEGHKFAPPWSARHGGLSPRARAWRECCKQIALAMRTDGISTFTEASARANMGRRWAWHLTQKIRAAEFFLHPRMDAATREGMTAHNEEARELMSDTRRGPLHVGHATWTHWYQDDLSLLAREHWRARRDNRRACRDEAMRLDKLRLAREAAEDYGALAVPMEAA